MLELPAVLSRIAAESQHQHVALVAAYGVRRMGWRVLHTLLRAGEVIVAASTTGASGLLGVPHGALGTSIALSGAWDGLVNNLGRWLRLPVGVELWVVACVARVRDGEWRRFLFDWEMKIPRSSYRFCKRVGS